MAIRVFPVIGNTAWSDTFNPNGHQGEDIFAPRGAPIVAVDDGVARMTTDPKGGLVVYLTTGDGQLYYYAHLDSFELPAGSGDPNAAPVVVLVRADQTLGYVGSTGNAQGKDPHLHFEMHPDGTRLAANPASELHAAPQGAQRPGKVVQQPPGPVVPAPATGTPPPYPLAAKALLTAYSQKHNGATPPQPGMTYAMGQAIAEGSFTYPFVGSNNFGAMHAVQQWADAHANDVGYGMIAFTDSGPGVGFYITRMMVFPSLLIGARAFLDAVERNVDLAHVNDEVSYAAQHYRRGYFQMSHPTAFEKNQGMGDPTPLRDRAAPDWTPNQADQLNINDYANAVVKRGVPVAATALANAANETRDPAARSVGPPFAPLADRLWSDGRKHTLDEAVAHIQGRGLLHPPAGGGITLDEAKNAPDGAGVWLFGKGATPKPQPPTPKPKPVPDRVASSGSTSAPLIVFSLVLAAVTGGIVYAVQREKRMMRLTTPPRPVATSWATARARRRDRDCGGWDPNDSQGWDQCDPRTVPRSARKYLTRRARKAA